MTERHSAPADPPSAAKTTRRVGRSHGDGLHAVPVPCLKLANTGQIVDANPAAGWMLRAQPDDLLARDLGEFVTEGDREAYRFHLDVFSQSRRAHTCELQLHPLEGPAFHARLDGAAGDSGQCIHVAITDVTDRKRAVEVLRRREGILEAVAFASQRFLNTPAWSEHIDEVLARLGQASDVSRVCLLTVDESDTDWPPLSQLRTWQHADNPHPGCMDSTGQALFRDRADDLRTGQAVVLQPRRLPEDQQDVLRRHHIQSLAIVPVFAGASWWGCLVFEECYNDREWSAAELDAVKTAAGILGEAVLRSHVEQALRTSESRLRQILDLVPHHIHAKDDQGRFLMVNKAFADSLGRTPAEVVGRKHLDLAANRVQAVRMLADDREVIESGRPKAIPEQSYTDVHGQTHWLSTTKVPFESWGEPAVLVAAIDISERKRAEQQIRRYSRNLEVIVQHHTHRIKELETERSDIEKMAAQGRIAAQIAHEINNPLAGIKNSFLLIKDAVPHDHPYYEYVDRIQREIDRIADIVRQMFGIYRGEPGQQRRVALHEIVQHVTDVINAAHRHRDVTVEAEVPHALAVSLPRKSLLQVLFNVVQNAVEASPPGQPVRITATNAGENVILHVIDRGAGIPAELGCKVYQPLFSTKSSDGSVSGLGLGLSITRNLVHEMGGHISFTSVPGEGTDFTLTLPRTLHERTTGDATP